MKETLQLELNHTAAQLLARLAAEMGSDDPSGLVIRALGLLDLAQRTKRQGGRLYFKNERGEEADVVF